MLNHISKISLLLFTFSNILFPQNVENTKFNFISWALNYPSHLIRGIEYSFLVENKQVWFLSSSIITLTLSRFDKDLSNEFVDDKLFSHNLSRIADSYGKKFGWGYFAGIGFITIESILKKNDFKTYFNKVEIVLESIAVSQLITQTLKVTTFRERPNKGDNHSFPSGHTSSTFALASSLEGIYGISVGLPAYIFASIVGLQRISTNAHYLSDVLGGVIIGIFVGKGYSEIHKDNKEKSLSVIPYYDQRNLNYSIKIQVDL